MRCGAVQRREEATPRPRNISLKVAIWRTDTGIHARLAGQDAADRYSVHAYVAEQDPKPNARPGQAGRDPNSCRDSSSVQTALPSYTYDGGSGSLSLRCA